MIFRALRKRLALLVIEWRYRGQPAALATRRRSIGGRYRITNGRKKREHGAEVV